MLISKPPKLVMPRRKILKAAIAALILSTATMPAPALVRGGLTAGGGGATFNNLLLVPGATNRPTISGSTLSFIGPLGGGPSTTTDVAQTVNLVTHNGTYTTSHNGEIIEGLDIINGDGVVVLHDNCILRKCRVLGGTFVSVSLVGSNTLIEDCLLDGNTGQEFEGVSRNPTFNPVNFTLRRCNSLNYSDNVTQNHILNATVIDNWFHSAQLSDADMVELYGGTNGVLVQHNTFDGRDTAPGAGLNSGVNMTDTDLSGVLNIQVINNFFLNHTGNTINDAENYQDHPGVKGTVTWTCINNGFFNCVKFRDGDSTPSINSGNFVMASATATSGALCNGTGVI